MPLAGLVGVVIPTHNRKDRLLACLAHVRVLTDASCCPIVVYDGCTDGSQAAAEAAFPDVVAVEGDGNLWWSGCINAGTDVARRIDATHILILNDDVRPAPDMLGCLLQASVYHPDAIIGSKVLFADEPGRIWCAGGTTDWWRRGSYAIGNGADDGPGWCGLREVHWLPGMGTLVPMGTMDRLGGMDAVAFPQYFADVDFCLRARQVGIPVLQCGDARLYNDVRSTGAMLPSGRVDLKTCVTILSSLRSHANWRPRFRFWGRHCPPPLIPWQAVRFYGPLLAVMLKKLTWDHLRSSP